MKISITVSLFVVFCMASGCGRPLPAVHDASALAEASAKMPELLGVSEHEPVLIYRRPAHMTNGTLEFITTDYQPVVAPIPEPIRAIQPTDILVTEDVVLLQLHGGGVAQNEGVCVFLSRDEKRVRRVADALRLVAVDLDARVYRYSLYDFRMIPDTWDDAEQAEPTVPVKVAPSTPSPVR